MRYIGRLPFMRDEFVVEVHLGWTVAYYLIAQLPLIGRIVRHLVWEIF